MERSSIGAGYLGGGGHSSALPLVSFNLTDILEALSSLDPHEKLLLLNEFGYSSEQELFCFLRAPQCNMFIKGYEHELMKYDSYRIHKFLLLYIPPIMIILGTIGNILSFIILTHRSMRKLSTYLYLAVLSVTDTLVLYVGLLRLWVGELTGSDFREHAAWTCKTINVLGYTVSDYSVWLIIAVTVERWIAVCHPLKAPSVCNRTRATFVILGILLLLTGLNLHFFWTTEIRNFVWNNETIVQCDSGEPYEMLVQKIWPWIDALIYSFLPFVIILTLNGLIINKVLLSKKKRADMAVGSMQQRMDDPRHRSGSHENSAKVTVMLLTISFTFLLTTLPMNILLIINAFITETSVQTASRVRLARAVTELLMYSNHSMNFFLYCATGEKFRHQLIKLFCPRRALAGNRNWMSDCNQGMTENTVLTHHGVHAVNPAHCKRIISPYLNRQLPPLPAHQKSDFSGTVTRENIPLTHTGVDTCENSPVQCGAMYNRTRNDTTKPLVNGGSNSNVEYTRIKSEGEV